VGQIKDREVIIMMMNVKELIKAKEIARQLDKQLEKLSKKEQPKEENLCPDCNIFCEQRFIDGICK